VWDWRPDPEEDPPTWSGTCSAGRKEGRGVIQWFEHGRPIDRFQGSYRRDKREGFGHYEWPMGQSFQGTYEADLPNGRGTVTISGASFTGTWRRGCLVSNGKRIAIGVPLDTCGGGNVAESGQ
jgi:hypothetical protein